MKRLIDLNCDLGEGESLARTKALMRSITSANIACGGHSGSVHSMEVCLNLAGQLGVRAGAHPGLFDRAGFGRAPANVSPDDLELLLLQQVSAFSAIARKTGVQMHHIKLHGALYHACETSRTLAQAMAAAARQWWPKVKLYARANGELSRAAREIGMSVWEEAFLDRNYLSDGSLVPRMDPGALIADPAHARQRIRELLATGAVTTLDGRSLKMNPRTLCIHSDTSNAPVLARQAAAALGASLLPVQRAGSR